MRQSYEGLVGRRYPELGVFITSPNMKVFTPLLYGTRDVRLLGDLHYGQDDPMFFPQPFDKRVPHLAVLRHPSQFAAHEIMLWFVPEREHFKVAASSDPGQGLGHIDAPFRDLLKGEYVAIKRRLWAETKERGQEGLSTDGKIVFYSGRLKYLLGRLSLPATFNEAVSAWRMTQRTLLELDARIVWLVDICKISHTPQRTRARLRNVVGAVTDQLDVAENLFRCGVPIWLLRPLQADTGVAVGTWFDDTPVDNLPTRKFNLCVSLRASDSAAHPVIFTGKAGDVERYRAMGEYMWRLAFPKCSLYGDGGDRLFIEHGPVQSATEPVTVIVSSPSLSGPSRTPRTKSSPTTPYVKVDPKAKTMARKFAPPTRNKFVDIPSTLMPPMVRAWLDASQLVGKSFNHSTPGRPGLNRGYVLPDPNIIAGHSNENSRAAYFTTYLKLRQVLMYRVTLANINPLGQNDWRKLIGMELHGSRTDSKSSQARSNLQDMLMECMDSGMEASVDFEHLGDCVVQWRGSTLAAFQHPTKGVCREVLWEMNEVGFRYELLALDDLLYRYMPKGFDADPENEEGELQNFEELDASNAEDRRIKILGFMPHFNGRIVPEDIEDGQKGFASSDAQDRQSACWALFSIMRGWLNMPRPMSNRTIAGGWKLAPPVLVSIDELFDIEYHLAFYYVTCFSYVFKRAPTLPRNL